MNKNDIVKKVNQTGFIVAACAAVGGVGIGAVVADSGETHCAYYSLEDEYNLMRDCVNRCGSYNTSKCAERIRQFECNEKSRIEEEQKFHHLYSCPL